MPRERNPEAEFNKRRPIIFRRVVLDNRPLSFTEMRELLDDADYDYSPEKQDSDLKAFQAIGCPIQIRKSRADPKVKEIVYLEGPHTDDDTTRESIHIEEKKLVAQLTASLICGSPSATKNSVLPSWMEGEDARNALERMVSSFLKSQEKRSDMRVMEAHVSNVFLHLAQKIKPHTGNEALENVNEVLSHLKFYDASLAKHHDALKSKLYTFWDETSRLIAIDSGTTNIILSRFLKKIPLPLQGSRLCSLTVCTNSRRIFEELGPSDVWIKTIIIGGQQMYRSPTIAGAMAELFLRSASILQFSICILGSTRIDLDRFAICSDSQEESSIKNLFMDRSSLRVIVVDNFKFQTGPGREGYRFASIDPKHVDLIITNSPLCDQLDAEAINKSFVEKINAIESRGVPVLVASSPKTFKYR